MTTLNGLPRAWDYFIQEICARKNLVKFSNCGRNSHKKKIEYQLEKKRWEVNIKLSWYTPNHIPSQPKEDLITPEVSTFTKVTLENIYLGSYVIHVTKQDIMQEIVLRNKN